MTPHVAPDRGTKSHRNSVEWTATHKQKAGELGLSLAFGYHEDRTLTHGYVETREAAMGAFAKSWWKE